MVWLSLDQWLDRTGRGCKSPLPRGWRRWLMHPRHLPCNSGWALTCHSNEVTNFLGTQRPLLTPRLPQRRSRLGSGFRRRWGSRFHQAAWGEGRYRPGFGRPAPPAPPRDVSPLWRLTSLSLNTLCRLFSPDLNLRCSCHLEHPLCSLQLPGFFFQGLGEDISLQEASCSQLSCNPQASGDT